MTTSPASPAPLLRIGSNRALKEQLGPGSCVLGSIEVFRYVLERFLFGCDLAFGRSNPAVLGDLGGGFRVLESEAKKLYAILE